ncbi:hypothetical protein SAMN04488515_1619 [Cognatiyoonia koreensis]|uniref:Uncharacterized protein n=2 Tax=Cognatiyoonia koreensis TaxID=364200 RepID=A0A1I0Q2B2_9RHOB|nr:hypothetical protein SAMN04488515_1619 [Cognatiyoonia koreensis]
MLSPVIFAGVCGVLGRFMLKRWAFLGMLVFIMVAMLGLFGLYEGFLRSLDLFDTDNEIERVAGRDASTVIAVFAMVLAGLLFFVCGTVGLFIGAAFRTAKMT